MIDEASDAAVERRDGPNRAGIARPTLAQVAAAAGVSSATASQVLNNRANCWASEETRQQIRAAAIRLGYRPNIAARSLRSGATHTIGLVTTGLGLGARRNRITGLDDAAIPEGYMVSVSVHANSPEMEDRFIRRHLDRGVDALAVYPSETGTHTELRRLAAAGFPVVTFDGHGRFDFECDDVSPDFEAVGRLQVRHALEIGRRRLCVANTVPSAWINDVREAAVHAEARDRQLPAPLWMGLRQSADEEMPPADLLFEQARTFVREHRGTFDVVIGYDAAVLIVARALLEAGVRIPEDVALIGAGNSVMSTYGVLPLTTVDTRDDDIGQQACQLLLDRIRNPDLVQGFRARKTLPRLIARQSSGLATGTQAAST